ncbi:hypothetical protein [Granulicella tundricola]|uniref:Uncharacterized protein n=1 Tax=Granulicella tundricola (strain ATCC BAA-1859 / DSM 23138 / MP5ACTX9) TaxID=1198114 RepID=E8X7S5_GRATM|nr:hypothetical protein [Granulicella tundricola]ADW71509.1 hypothetical protein AciX9_4579 [Granulicella tundricola MP5ACTX9]
MSWKMGKIIHQTSNFFVVMLLVLITQHGSFDKVMGAQEPLHVHAITDAVKNRANATRASLEAARQSDSFVDAVGVDTHLSYDNTPYYREWPKVSALLRSSGIRHIRDGYHDWEPSSAFVKEHRELALAGIHTTYIIPNDPKTTSDDIVRFSHLVKDLEALEAPNECDAGQNCGGGGKRGIENAVNFQPLLHRTGDLLDVPVLGPSFTSQEAYAGVGKLSQMMTMNNLHVYFGGRNPGNQGWGAGDPEGHNYGSLDWWIDQARLDGDHLPVTITETGYLMPEKPTPYTLPRPLGGAYIMRTLLLAFNHHVTRTFLYELLDEVSSPDYGLLTADLQDKPAFTALRSLIKLLSDPGPPFAPDALPYELRGGDKNLGHTLLQKRDGTFFLIVWNEESQYDPAKCVLTVLQPKKITLQLGPGFVVTSISTFPDTGVMTTTATAVSGATTSLSIDGNPTIIKISSHVP